MGACCTGVAGTGSGMSSTGLDGSGDDVACGADSSSELISCTPCRPPPAGSKPTGPGAGKAGCGSGRGYTGLGMSPILLLNSSSSSLSSLLSSSSTSHGREPFRRALFFDLVFPPFPFD